jgi:hypothetical protein
VRTAFGRNQAPKVLAQVDGERGERASRFQL